MATQRWILASLRPLLVALGLFFAGNAAAQTATPSVEQFFTVDPEDKSAALLAQVFGPDVWETVNGAYSPQTQEHTGVVNNADQSGVLGAISLVLNLGCMLLTIIIIFWGAISANMSGTLDGSDAGRRYNLLWTPLRSVYSFGLLLPVIGGYSLIQVLMMKLMLVSIGIANAGYTIVTDRMFEGRATAPVMRPDVNGAVQAMLDIALCQKMLTSEQGAPLIQATNVEVGTAKAEAYTSVGNFIHYLGESDGNIEFGRNASQSFDGIPGSGFGQGACGSWRLQQSNGGRFSADAAVTAAQQLFNDRLSATNELKAAMDNVAQLIMQHSAPSSSAALPSATGAPSSPLFDQAFAEYRRARDAYRSRLQDAARVAAATMTRSDVQKAIDPTGGHSSSQARDAAQEIQSGGWLMTGAIYWNLNAINRSILDVQKTLTPSVVRPPMDDITSRSTVDDQAISLALATRSKLTSMVRDDIAYKESTGQAKAYLSAQGEIESTPDAIDQMFNAILEWMPSLRTLDESCMKILLGDGDFVTNMINWGNYAWNTALTLIGGAMALDLADGAASAWKDGLVGTVATGVASAATLGVSDILIGGGLKALGKAVGLMYGFAVPLLIIGFAFAFYLPMVPMILWAINVCGWLIQVVKAFIAGPIWAAAHSIPEGEGIAGQHARQGYMLILGILLRPILLVIGLIVGGIILQVTGWFLRYTLPLMFASFDTSGATGFCGFLATTLIVGALCMTIALKSFSLSFEIADEILDWIGGNQRSLGDSEQSARVQAMATGVFANYGARGLAGAGGNAIRRMGERRGAAMQKAQGQQAAAVAESRHKESIAALKGGGDRSNHVTSG